jgi:phosphatidylserine/phosphatidylglycerophosphate/cardiolipin synthase-like enzyme
MRKVFLFLSALVFAITSPAEIKVFFSPNGGCTEAIVSALNNAKTNVQIAAYSFTSAPIAKALVDAKKRGVNVVAILDDSNQTDKYSAATFLTNARIKTLIDRNHKIAHNKYIIIDSGVVITGSFNFSKAAEESNAENLLVISDPQLAGKYQANWSEHLQHAQTFVRKLAGAKAPQN